MQFLAKARVMSPVIFVSEARVTRMLVSEKIASQRIAPPSLQQPKTTKITTMADAGRNGPLALIPPANTSKRVWQGPLRAKT